MGSWHVATRPQAIQRYGSASGYFGAPQGAPSFPTGRPAFPPSRPPMRTRPLAAPPFVSSSPSKPVPLNRLFTTASAYLRQRPVQSGAIGASLAGLAYLASQVWGNQPNPAHQGEGLIPGQAGGYSPNYLHFDQPIGGNVGISWHGDYYHYGSMQPEDTASKGEPEDWQEYLMTSNSFYSGYNIAYNNQQSQFPTGFTNMISHWTSAQWTSTSPATYWVYIRAAYDRPAPWGWHWSAKHWFHKTGNSADNELRLETEPLLEPSSPPVFYPHPLEIPVVVPGQLPTVEPFAPPKPRWVPRRTPRPDPYSRPVPGGASNARPSAGGTFGATFTLGANSPSPGVSRNPPRGPTPVRTHEKKTVGTEAAVAVLGTALMVTEVEDIVDAIGSAHPTYSPGHALHDKLEFIVVNADEIDWGEAIANVIINEGQDLIIGLIGAGASNALRNQLDRDITKIPGSFGSIQGQPENWSIWYSNPVHNTGENNGTSQNNIPSQDDLPGLPSWSVVW